MQEILLPSADDLTKSNLLFERQPSGLYLPTWQKGKGGAAYILDAGLNFGPIYDDGTWQYFGEANPGTELTSADWRVSRINKTTGQEQWADGDSNFDNFYTDLTTVQGFFFR